MKLFHGSDVKNNIKKKEAKKSVPKIKDVICILRDIHPLGKIPESIKGLLILSIIITVLYNFVSSMFVYFLEGAKSCVIDGKYFIGLICFILYVSRYVFSGILRVWQSVKSRLLSMKVDLYNQELATKLLGKTAGKVEYSTRVIKNTVSGYFSAVYELRRRCITAIITIGTSLLSMLTTIYIIINDDNSIYSILTVVILIISYMFFLVIDNKIQKSWDGRKEIRKEIRDKSINYENDLINREYISFKHFSFLAKRYLKSEEESRLEGYNMFKEIDKMELVRECVSIFSLIGILFLQYVKLGSTFSLEVFLELISLYTIISTLMSTAGQIVSNLSGLKQQVTSIREEEQAFKKIVSVYEKENNKELKNICGEKIEIEPYNYETTNFSLKIKNDIILKKGKMVLLNGESGTGKTTLIDIITGDKGNHGYNVEAIKYHNGACLGSGTVLEEVTWGEELDYNKFVEVLKGTQIYDSLKSKAENNSLTLIEYLSSIKKDELSDGMEQRLVLASILYHLDDTTDLLLFDEPISAIDEGKAIRIVEFLKNYCNKDRKRFVLIATHQYKWILEYVDDEVKFNKISELQTVIN
ncbi:MAG: ABC transporter ATP-binding protein [Clostridiales bacterium]|nr:ABC transporter ATP-binding protein [Clostridiales bacterium]